MSAKLQRNIASRVVGRALSEARKELAGVGAISTAPGAWSLGSLKIFLVVEAGRVVAVEFDPYEESPRACK